MLSVVADRIGARRIDDDRAIVAELFLQARMTVIPVGPRLDDRKFVDEFRTRSEEHTSELQSLMRISYAVFCLKKKKPQLTPTPQASHHSLLYNTLPLQFV